MGDNVFWVESGEGVKDRCTVEAPLCCWQTDFPEWNASKLMMHPVVKLSLALLIGVDDWVFV